MRYFEIIESAHETALQRRGSRIEGGASRSESVELREPVICEPSRCNAVAVGVVVVSTVAVARRLYFVPVTRTVSDSHSGQLPLISKKSS